MNKSFKAKASFVNYPRYLNHNIKIIVATSNDKSNDMLPFEGLKLVCENDILANNTVAKKITLFICCC